MLSTAGLEILLESMVTAGYRLVGPTLESGVVHYREISAVEDLPFGIIDQQQPGHYRSRRSPTEQVDHYFDWSNGTGVKGWLFPSQQRLWRSERQQSGVVRFERVAADGPPLALFGIRSCDLAAIRRLDRHFLRPGAEDPWYAERNAGRLLVVVSCNHPAADCFCHSTATGPAPSDGYDLRLDELDEGFLITAGTARGEQLLQPLPLAPVTAAQRQRVALQLQQSAAQQQRRLPSAQQCRSLGDLPDAPVWQQIAERCLGCGNCTASCPSCFCHRQQPEAQLDPQQAIQQRLWDSCFSTAHSQLHGVAVRNGVRERYRQWLTHKLSGWWQQFGEGGCVGCGRCITWCPVGIDLTVEVARLLTPEGES